MNLKSKFKTTFTLKQHTHIIHFQSRQNGATLRATELKPKFDKFLKQYAFDGKIPKEFLIPQQENALDYKVNIEPNFVNSSNIGRESLFFGNMGDGEDKEYKKNIKNFTIEFFSYKIELHKIIKKYFEAFLANTNFGTRQSKGYGGFYLENKEFDRSLIPYKVYSFKSSHWEKDIKILYSFLRQGINRVNRDSDTVFYTKPAIFAYAKSKGWIWEKKAIKEKYFNYNQPQNHSYIVRDLFGLSSEQSWGRTSVSKENNEIERFKSPITFKIIKDKVYFWANESVVKILDKEFEVKYNKKGDLKLKTPEIFNFDDFFTFTFKINLSTHIEEEFHNQTEYGILTRMFKEIKNDL